MIDGFRKYNSNREIIKLDLVDVEDYTDNVIICVPKFAYDVARSMLAHYAKFRTSYATEYQEQFYKLPDDAEFDTIEASIDLFLGSRDMTCDISEGLECICNQLAELTAATYTSSVSSNYAGSPEQVGGESGETPPLGAGVPDPAITDRKCKAAHFIVDNIQLMLFDLLTTAPPAWYSIGEVQAYLEQIGLRTGFANMVGSIYGFYSTLASAVFGATIDFEAIYDDIVAQYDDIICELHGAGDALSARDGFLGELTVTGDDYDFVADLLFNNILNTLWFSVEDSETRIDGWPATVDCDACAGCDASTITVAQGSQVDDDEFESGENEVNLWQYIQVFYAYDGSAYCGEPVTVDSLELISDDTNPLNGNMTFRFFNQAGVKMGPTYYDTPPTNITQVGYVIIHHTSETNPHAYTGSFVWRINIS